MPWLDKRSRDLHCKLVYLGPGLCGKSANVHALWQLLPVPMRLPLIHLATETQQTAPFECLPILLGELAGVRVRLHIYTAPGNILYEPSRRTILHGADAVVFVADSRAQRLEANAEALADLTESASHEIDVPSAPAVVQYNRRDSADALPVAQLQGQLNSFGAPYVEAVASEMVGVQETFRLAAGFALTHAERWVAA